MSNIFEVINQSANKTSKELAGWCSTGANQFTETKCERVIQFVDGVKNFEPACALRKR